MPIALAILISLCTCMKEGSFSIGTDGTGWMDLEVVEAMAVFGTEVSVAVGLL